VIALTVAAIGDAHAQVDPGAPLIVTVSPGFTPYSLNYDWQNGSLYSVALNSSNVLVFGSIDPLTGVFTQIGAPLNDSLLIGSEFAIKPSNILTGDPAHALLLRSDGLLDVNLGTKTMVIDPPPRPDSPSAITFDPLAKLLYGRTSSGLDAVDLTTGHETQVQPYGFEGGPFEVVTALDPYNKLVYFVEFDANGNGFNIISIRESDGSIAARRPLSLRVDAIGFDFSNGKNKKNSLYGLTTCCDVGLPDKNYIVRIDESGAESIVVEVGDNATKYSFGFANSTSGNDRHFSTSSTNQIVSVDAAEDRSWYIESPITESDHDLQSWMTSAGAALGLRNSAVNVKRQINSILAFGTPAKRKKKFGASFGRASRFLSVDQIQAAVIAFADGWYSSIGASPSNLHIVVGTTNFEIVKDKKSNLTSAHGRAWADMLLNVNLILLTKPYSGRVDAIAGLDIELDWSKSEAVNRWASGFGSSDYADFGEAAGCPNKCNNGWTPIDRLEVGGSETFPQIYSTGKGNARTWAQLSDISQQTFGHSLKIVSALSQRTACDQRGGCNGTDNTPMASWSQMIDELSLLGDPATAERILPSTNIQHRVE